MIKEPYASGHVRNRYQNVRKESDSRPRWHRATSPAALARGRIRPNTIREMPSSSLAPRRICNSTVATRAPSNDPPGLPCEQTILLTGVRSAESFTYWSRSSKSNWGLYKILQILSVTAFGTKKRPDFGGFFQLQRRVARRRALYAIEPMRLLMGQHGFDNLKVAAGMETVWTAGVD